MLNLEKKNLRENMITVCSQVHSFFLSCFSSFKFWPKCHYCSTVTALGKTVFILTATLRAPNTPSLLYFYSIYHLLIYWIVFLFIMFIVGVSPQNCKPGQRKFGCFGHLCAPALGTVPDPSGEHSSIGWMNSNIWEALRCRARSWTLKICKINT